MLFLCCKWFRCFWLNAVCIVGWSSTTYNLRYPVYIYEGINVIRMYVYNWPNRGIVVTPSRRRKGRRKERVKDLTRRREMHRLRATFTRSRTPTGAEMKTQSSLDVPKQVGTMIWRLKEWGRRFVFRELIWLFSILLFTILVNWFALHYNTLANWPITHY